MVMNARPSCVPALRKEYCGSNQISQDSTFAWSPDVSSMISSTHPTQTSHGFVAPASVKATSTSTGTVSSTTGGSVSSSAAATSADSVEAAGVSSRRGFLAAGLAATCVDHPWIIVDLNYPCPNNKWLEPSHISYTIPEQYQNKSLLDYCIAELILCSRIQSTLIAQACYDATVFWSA